MRGHNNIAKVVAVSTVLAAASLASTVPARAQLLGDCSASVADLCQTDKNTNINAANSLATVNLNTTGGLQVGAAQGNHMVGVVVGNNVPYGGGGGSNPVKPLSLVAGGTNSQGNFSGVMVLGNLLGF